jgi:copper(I)-binding protein
MKNHFITLVLAFFSVQVVAMNHGQHMDHNAQPTEFQEVTADGITFSNFRVRAIIGLIPNSSAYGEIRSTSNNRLIKVTSSSASVVELHEHINDNGVMRMREVKAGFAVDPSAPIMMKPGGYHIMLTGLMTPLEAGTTIDLSLAFESGETFDLTVPVVSTKTMNH